MNMFIKFNAVDGEYVILTRKTNLIFNVKTPGILYMYISKCNFAAVWH